MAEPSAETVPEPLAQPLPAGRWPAENAERTSCIDCPTARFAVVLGTGSLEELTARDWPSLAAGYPLFLADGELGLGFGAPSGVVAAFYGERADADRAVVRLGGRVVALPDAPPLGSVTIVTLTESVTAHIEPGGAERCRLPGGDRFRFERDQLWSGLEEEQWWVPVRCAEGPAFVPVSATDLDRTTIADGGRARTTQPVSGVCGVTFYRDRIQQADGGWTERELTSDPSCIAEHEPSDAWAVCPNGTLGSCVTRASSLAAADRGHAKRLMSYACRFGEIEGCSRLVQLDVERGLHLLWSWCHGEHADACARLDVALRATDPATLEGAVGGLELYACERGLEPWCQRLDRSSVCDRQGCG